MGSGSVVFKVKTGGGATVGTATAAFSTPGAFSTIFVVPVSQAAGNYQVEASYSTTATGANFFAPSTGTNASAFTIFALSLTATATASAATQVGQAYSQTNVASGGTLGYRYAVTGGTLPAGTH